MKAKSVFSSCVAVALAIASWNSMAQTRCSTDSYGNTTCRDSNGNTTRGRTDSYGNSTWRDSNGNTTRGSTDSYGNSTWRDSNGNTTRGSTDSYNNSTWRDSNGNTTRGSTDAYGNSGFSPFRVERDPGAQAEPFGRPHPYPRPRGGEVLSAGRARELAATSRNQPQALERIGVSDAVKGSLRRASPALDSAINARNDTACGWPASVAAEGGWRQVPHETA